MKYLRIFQILIRLTIKRMRISTILNTLKPTIRNYCYTLPWKSLETISFPIKNKCILILIRESQGIEESSFLSSSLILLNQSKVLDRKYIAFLCEIHQACCYFFS